MADKRCYYEVLEISKTASEGEISTSYRKLAIQYHPDKNPGDEAAIGRFKEASEAFEVLSDSEKRQRYDRFGHAGVNGQSDGGGVAVSRMSKIFFRPLVISLATYLAVVADVAGVVCVKAVTSAAMFRSR